MKLRMIAILLGILLVAGGAVTLGHEAITYTMHPEVIDLGPLTATTDLRTDRVPLPPIVGGVALLVGLIVLYLGFRARSNPSGRSSSTEGYSIKDAS